MTQPNALPDEVKVRVRRAMKVYVARQVRRWTVLLSALFGASIASVVLGVAGWSVSVVRAIPSQVEKDVKEDVESRLKSLESTENTIMDSHVDAATKVAQLRVDSFQQTTALIEGEVQRSAFQAKDRIAGLQEQERQIDLQVSPLKGQIASLATGLEAIEKNNITKDLEFVAQVERAIKQYGNADELVSQVIAHQVPIGSITAFAGSQDMPDGWLLCAGQEVSRCEYHELLKAIGTLWGAANDADKFKIPDLRGLFLRGIDNGAKNDPDGLTRAIGSFQADLIKDHVHQLSLQYKQFLFSNISPPGATIGGPIGANADDQIYSGVPIAATAGHASIGGAETRPKNAAVNWIIRAK